MGAGLLAVKSGFILFIKNYQFPLQINTLERERDIRCFFKDFGIPSAVSDADFVNLEYGENSY
jgi:hypothetical protein